MAKVRNDSREARNAVKAGEETLISKTHSSKKP